MNETDEFKININGNLLDSKEKAGELIKNLYPKTPKGQNLYIGNYKGFNLYLKKSLYYGTYEMIVQGNMKYRMELGDSSIGNITRLENVLRGFENKMKDIEMRIEEYERNLENAKKEYKKPFSYEEEYKSKLLRLHELNQEFNINKNDDNEIDIERNEDGLEEILDELEI